MANAGITDDTLLLRMSEEQFTAGPRRQPHRRRTGSPSGPREGCCAPARGRMIFISSVVGLSGAPGQANYAASKAGLIGLARSITRELGSR